jgi:hypothetical protein
VVERTAIDGCQDEKQERCAVYAPTSLAPASASTTTKAAMEGVGGERPRSGDREPALYMDRRWVHVVRRAPRPLRATRAFTVGVIASSLATRRTPSDHARRAYHENGELVTRAMECLVGTGTKQLQTAVEEACAEEGVEALGRTAGR